MDDLAWAHVVIYFAQIVMPRLRKISPNCAQIVLEKKNITKLFLARSKFLSEITVFLKKNDNSRKTKKSRVGKHSVFRIKFLLKFFFKAKSAPSFSTERHPNPAKSAQIVNKL